MADDIQSLFSGLDDAQLNALYEQLSKGVTQEELSSGGISATHDGTRKFSLGEGWKSSARDVGKNMSIWGASKARSKKKAYMKRRRAANAAQEEARQSYMDTRAQRFEQLKQEIQRRQLKSRVNAYFNSESMRGLYDTLENRHLQNSLAQITEQYGNQLKQSAFQSAGQGLIGSSVDAERRGDVQQAQNAAAIQAQGQAQQFAQGVRNQNEQQRQSLVDTLSSGNPYQGAQFDQQMQQIGNQTNQMAQQYANQTAQNQISQYGLNMQSQALGNLFSNAANLYSTNYAGGR